MAATIQTETPALDPPAARLPGAPGATEPVSLEVALGGLRAALDRRRVHEMAYDAEEPPLNRPLPGGRTASGLRDAELKALAERVERLLPPSTSSPPAPEPGS